MLLPFTFSILLSAVSEIKLKRKESLQIALHPTRNGSRTGGFMLPPFHLKRGTGGILVLPAVRRVCYFCELPTPSHNKKIKDMKANMYQNDKPAHHNGENHKDNHKHNHGHDKLAPFLKKRIELGTALAYVSSRDSVPSTNLVHHLGDFSGRDTLQIHFGNAEIESPVNAQASFKPRNGRGKRSLHQLVNPYRRSFMPLPPVG